MANTFQTPYQNDYNMETSIESVKQHVIYYHLLPPGFWACLATARTKPENTVLCNG